MYDTKNCKQFGFPKNPVNFAKLNQSFFFNIYKLFLREKCPYLILVFCYAKPAMDFNGICTVAYDKNHFQQFFMRVQYYQDQMKIRIFKIYLIIICPVVTDLKIKVRWLHIFDPDPGVQNWPFIKSVSGSETMRLGLGKPQKMFLH